MKKICTVMITMLMIVSLNICVLAEDTKTKEQEQEQEQEQKQNTKSINRYRKFFGDKKKDIGQDYAAQSTAGVEAAAAEGLKSSEKSANLDSIKDDLYKDALETIDKVIKAE